MSAAFDVPRHVTTATITTMLLKKGIRHCWIKGALPLVAGGERPAAVPAGFVALVRPCHARPEPARPSGRVDG